MRLDELFPFPAERTESSDSFYAAFGRAVAFCTLFEANCRTLANLLGLKANADQTPLTEELIDRVLQELAKRRLANHLDAIATRLGLGPELRQVFRAGREARNTIAHEFGIGVERDVGSDGGRAKRLGELSDLVGQVADANLRVSALSQLVTGEEMPPPEFARSYSTRVKEWICDI